MTRSRVLTIARHEARTHLRSPLLWGLLASVTFATLTVNPAAMIPSGSAAVEGLRPFSNSVHAMAQSFSLTGLLFYPFLASMLAGLSVIHDDEARVGDLLHSTPLTAGEYATGKCLGVMAVLTGVLATHVALALGWYECGGLVGGDTYRGPFAVTHYLWPALLFVFPGMVWCAGVAFAVGVRFRMPVGVYLVPTIVFAVTVLALGTQEPLGWWDVPLDLWGARWLSQSVFTFDRGITFYNSAALPLDSAFLMNRLAVLLVPTVAVWMAARHLTRALRGAVTVRTPAGRAAVSASPLPFSPVGTLAMTRRAPGLLQAVRVVAAAELRHLRAQPALYLFIVFAAALAWETVGSARGPLDSAVIATAGGLAVGLIEVITSVGCLLLLFHLVEALSRAERVRLDALVYSSPISTTALLGGIWAAGAVLTIGVLLACGAVGMLALLLQPVGAREWWPFVVLWGVGLAPTFLMWTAMVTAVWTWTGSRPLTYVVSLGVLMVTVGLTVTGAHSWLTNWPLWGALRWTDAGPFEMHGHALLANRVLILMAALLFAVMAYKGFVRRTGTSRIRGWSAALTSALVIVTAGTAGLGSWMASQIAVGPDGSNARGWRDRYRAAHAAGLAGPAPAVRHLDANITVMPDHRRVHIDARFVLGPEAGEDQLAFTVGPALRDVRWWVDDVPVIAQVKDGVHLLAAPGRPVRQIRVTHEVVWPTGFTRNGGALSEFVLPSSLVLQTLGPNLLPIPGYSLGDGGDRRPAMTVRLLVRSPQGFTVNATGAPVNTSVLNGWTTTKWVTSEPVRYLSLAGGRWETRQNGADAVSFDPRHAWNVDAILRTLTSARSRYSEWLGPYPWSALRLSAYPDHATRAQSFPSSILFSEGFGMFARPDAQVPLPAIVTAHEVAHQWWPHRVRPAEGPGADVLIEGMANYLTMRFLEVEHGAAARQAFATQIEREYLGARRVDIERSLLHTTAETGTDEVVAANKGAWVLWMLERRIGEAAMLGGLRRFVAAHSDEVSPPVTLTGLLEHLCAGATEVQACTAFTERWAAGIGLPEFVVGGASVAREGTGWRVSATLRNVGAIPAVVIVSAMGDQARIDQTVFAPAGESVSVSWVIAERPRRIVVDPGIDVLQMNRSRATAELPSVSGGAR